MGRHPYSSPEIRFAFSAASSIVPTM
jgi:hypothetical protein